MIASSAPLLSSLLAFFAVLLLCLGLLEYNGYLDRLSRIKNRVSAGSGGKRGKSGSRRSKSILSALKEQFLGLVHQLGKLFASKDRKELSRDRLRLMQAGFRGPNSGLIFWGVKCAFMLLYSGLTFGFMFLVGSALNFTIQSLLVIISALCGFYLPDFWLSYRVAKRKTLIMKELPDALDLLVVCVESGLGLDQAIHRVGDEYRMSDHAALHDELRLLTLELRAGKQRKQALKDLATRVGLEEVTSLTTLLIQSDLFGLSVAQTLRVASDSLRTKRYQKAETKAATLPVKLLFPLMFFIFPALFVVIMGPAAIRVMGIFSHG